MSDAARRMDRIYAPQRHVYDATRKFYLLGRDRLIRDLDPPDGARVLEIGCGTARNLIRIARTYGRVECCGLDISTKMLETAASKVARAGLGDRIRLAVADATRFDPATVFGVATFDRIVISYALSMIPPWREVLRHAASMMALSGSLHVVDFGDQAGLPPLSKALLVGWLARFHVEPRETLPDEVEALAREHGYDARTRSLYRGYAFVADIRGEPAPRSPSQ